MVVYIQNVFVCVSLQMDLCVCILICICLLSCFICGSTWWWHYMCVCVGEFSCLSAFCFVFTGVFIWVRGLCRAAPQVFVYESGSCGDLACKHTPALRALWITLWRTSHSASRIWTHLVTIHPLTKIFSFY